MDSLQQPAWIRHIIADIEASDYARIVLVVSKAGAGARARLVGEASLGAPIPPRVSRVSLGGRAGLPRVT